MNIKLNDWQNNFGRMPVDGNVKVTVKHRDGAVYPNDLAGRWMWDISVDYDHAGDIIEWKYADEEYFKRPKTASYSPDETKEEPVIKPVRIPEESIIVLRDAFNHMTGKSLTTEEVYGLALLIKLLGD